jgi:O-antigen/teichoic acid export membrane protein
MWGTGQNALVQVLNFLKVIVLARLIAPAEFGIYAVAMLVLVFIEAFSTTGFEDALVQEEDEVDHLLDTAWSIQLARGVLIFVLILFFAAPIASFMGSGQAGTIIVILGLSPLIRATSNLGVINKVREIKFRLPFVLAISEVISAFVASLLLVSVLGGSLALAWGVLIGLAVRSALSYILVPRTPRLVFSHAAARKLTSYGIWISLNRMVFVILLRLDAFFVAKLVGTTPLAVYQMGSRIADIGTKSISSSLGTVAFSSLSRLQGDPSRMTRALVEGVGLVAFFALPSAAFISAAGKDLIAVLLGDKWMEVSTVLALLVWSSSLRAVASTAGWAFKAAGRPSLDQQLSLLRAGVLLLAIWPLIKLFGMVGAAWAMVLSSVALIPMFVAGLNKLVSGLGFKAVKGTLMPALVACLVYLVVAPMDGIDGSPLVRLTIEVAAFVVVCSVGAAAMYLLTRDGPFKVVYKYLAERKG